ncbi:MAG: NAD-dependent succinate-semialdehyde dehydrogenase [Devosia sp.]
MMTDSYLLVDGEAITPRSRPSIDVTNPATATTLGQLPVASIEDIDRAAEASVRGFQEWKSRTALERARILSAAAVVIRQKAAEISSLVTAEQGKTLKEAAGEVAGAADAIQWLAEEGKRVYGRTVPSRVAGQEQIVSLEPVGPVAAFSPWNYPVALACRKIGHALAAGCSIVIKPAEECPAGVLALARIFIDQGVPPAALQVLFGRPAEISDRLIRSPHIRKISFTGSVEVGRALGALAGRELKKVTFELGGHAPVVVMHDADIARFVELGVAAKFRNAGQICTSPTRFLVHKQIYEEVVRRFAERACQLKVGNGMDDATDMGPLAHARRVEAMESFTTDAVSKGAKVVTGGTPAAGTGYFWRPTVLADVPAEALVTTNEPFGPLAVFTPFERLGDAIEEANGLSYGLAGYGFTGSLRYAREMRQGLRVGIVGINNFTSSTPEMPFAGVRDSGLGVAQGSEGLRDYLDLKSIYQAD